MAVVINTNLAATVAADNLASSSAMLQKSLNRLSSGSKIVNPADDAGGLAVSMKLSAAAKRQGAVSNNIANAVSMLQTQDGVLNVSGKILSRVSELKVLNSDITKSSSDRANYQSEFAALQAQLTASGAEQFNGVTLFGGNTLNVATTEDGATSIGMQGVPLLGTAAFPQYNAAFNNLSGWTTSIGAPSAAGGILTLTTPSQVISQATYAGPLQIDMQATFTGGGGSDISVAFGGMSIESNINTGTHAIKIVIDGSGNSSSFIDGSSTSFQNMSGLPTGAQTVGLFSLTGFAGVNVQNFSIKSTTVTGNVAAVASAGSLSTLSLSGISNAIQDVATYRAQNGASQSRLGYASELLTVNKANLEAANSRITDVDVAQESTSLARYNVLVQAGTSMLAQANQSSQSALKLLQ